MDGNDFVVGNFGSDTLLGGSGDDRILGDAFGPVPPFDVGSVDVCNGQQGFDLAGACELSNQMVGDLPLE